MCAWIDGWMDGRIKGVMIIQLKNDQFIDSAIIKEFLSSVLINY
jgi:hypothetical protein